MTPVVLTFEHTNLLQAQSSMNNAMQQLSNEGYVVKGSVSVSALYNPNQNIARYILAVIMVKKSRSKKSCRSSSSSSSS